MDPTPIVNLTPIMQLGFAGFCLIQFCTFVWLALKGITAVDSVRDALAIQTAATAAVENQVTELREDMGNRPCGMTIDQLRDMLRRLQPQSNS